MGNFFDRVNKGSILTLLTEIGGPALTVRHTSLKKTEISESCQKLFAGDAIVEPEVKEAALAWVPNAMRFLDAATEAPADPTEADDGEGEANEVEPSDGEGEPSADHETLEPADA